MASTMSCIHLSAFLIFLLISFKQAIEISRPDDNGQRVRIQKSLSGKSMKIEFRLGKGQYDRLPVWPRRAAVAAQTAEEVIG
jgi:hypothetical protein